MRRLSLAWILVALLALPVSAAVPGEISYQGLLLDDQGIPIQGTVALEIALYDAITAGTQLWTETHASVPVLDGVYDVVLGSITPLTPGLVAGGVLFLEIAVDGETLVPRQQLLSVPYALLADTAEVCETTLDVGGAPSDFVLQLFENIPYDGGDPPNDDPREGLGDADGDGIANFLESDNDNDGVSDVDELDLGSDINVATPSCCTFSPLTAEASGPSPVTIAGNGFDPGMTVTFGAQNTPPTNVTLTTADVTVGPQAPGTVPVVVTLPNGESANDTFEFVENTPVITSLDPPMAMNPIEVRINGSGFVPGISVSFGSANPVPFNISPTRFDVLLSRQPPGTVNVTVSYPSGQQDTTTFDWVDPAPFKSVFVTSNSGTGDLGGLAGADAICNALAVGSNLPGTYQAWLSDGTDSPATRFNQSGPYARADAAIIAHDWADLTDGSLGVSINRDELGRPSSFGINAAVWTGVASDGTSTGVDCDGFTNGATGTATWGFLSQNEAWTEYPGTPHGCVRQNHIYCFQQ